MKIKLTKKSEEKLMGWRAGAGLVFVSDGSGKGMRYSDMNFTKNGNNYFISIGNRKAIKLSDDQVKIIGDFYFMDEEEGEKMNLMTNKANKANKDEIREGPYEGFYEDGKLRTRCNYQAGKLEGLSEEFYEDGSLSCRCNYKDGLLVNEVKGK